MRATIAKPEMAILWDLASLYGIDFGRLLTLAGHAGRPASGSQRRRMTVALRALGQLAPGDQDEALRFMAGLKARRERAAGGGAAKRRGRPRGGAAAGGGDG